MRHTHPENHLITRIGWLRAAVLGANDGIISTASLVMGVATAASSSHDALIAGVAGLAAGAMAMAAGEYVSVSSQADTEHADLAREAKELKTDTTHEREELAQIYVARGVEPGLAREVSRQLMAKDALGAHARDDLGISETTTARLVQAALASAATFSIGAVAPLMLLVLSPTALLLPVVAVGSLLFLALLGMIGAKAGGADVIKPMIRVTFWGALAMAMTTGVGAIFGKILSCVAAEASAMPDQLPALALLFVLIFGLNLIPAFAPPTWMALALVGFQYHDTSALLLAGTGAVAATLGRLTLARLSHVLTRKKLLSDAHRANIDVIKDRLETRTTLTIGLFIFYAFSPLPSNFLFIAYGLTGLPLLRVALPFFIGRLASYDFFIVSGAAAGRRFEIDSMVSGAYALAWFLGTQLLILGALYCFTRVDWKVLFDNRKLVWIPKTASTSLR